MPAARDGATDPRQPGEHAPGTHAEQYIAVGRFASNGVEHIAHCIRTVNTPNRRHNGQKIEWLFYR